MFAKKESITSLSDDDLLLRYQEKSDMRIVGELYKRYAHLVLGTCMKYLQNKQEAEDTTMHVFEVLPNKISRHHITHFKSWLHIVVKNECLMQLRKRKHFSTTEDLIISGDSDVEHCKELEFSLEQLEFALNLLKDDQRICIELFYIESKSYKCIADELSVSINTVKSNIQNGKRNLKLQLERNHVGQIKK